MYIHPSVCLSHLRSAGFADQTGNKKQLQSHVLCTSLILRTESNVLIDIWLTEIRAVIVCYHFFYAV